MNAHQPAHLNLLTLPTDQRRVLTYLAREGPTDAASLAQGLGQEPSALQSTLETLLAQGAITLDAEGRVAAQLGRTRRRALPARLWPALQAGSRLYSAQEIATLRAVVPIVQFARGRLGQFTDHGPGHVLRVKSFATQLGYLLGLSSHEQHLLRAAALLHDVGNVVDRATHHIISQETVEKLAANGQLPFSPREAALVGLLCRWHRKEYDPDRTDDLNDETVRTGLLASILRVADALDSDYRRVDYGEKFQQVLELFYPQELLYVYDLDRILGIRICAAPHLQLQVFVQPQTKVEQSPHIRALRQDVADTPLNFTVPVIESGVRTKPRTAELVNDGSLGALRSALLVLPFDPHSLVMAALSRQHLQAAGYVVELLVYPDAPDATTWLWGEGLGEHNPARFAHLVLIGDRPAPDNTPALLATVARWQAADVTTTILNRHEANWTRLPDLLRMGAHVNLGGDWAYFWGDAPTDAAFFWGRIGALCTRDPIQSTVGLTVEEQRVSQGLLNAVFGAIATAAQQPPDDYAEWSAVAIPLLERIAADDRGWFAAQSAAFTRNFATLNTNTASKAEGQVKGRVLLFDSAATQAPYAVFWALEAAIEAEGRAPVRGIHFNMPYAIAIWPEPGAAIEEKRMVELLAINHWREEEATPIRLLYPADLGPPPEGNECAIRVRLPAKQAALVVQALVAACNEG